METMPWFPGQSPRAHGSLIYGAGGRKKTEFSPRSPGRTLRRVFFSKAKSHLEMNKEKEGPVHLPGTPSNHSDFDVLPPYRWRS